MWLVTLATLELHRSVRRPVEFGAGLFHVAVQTGLAGGTERGLLPQVVVAVQAVTSGHLSQRDLLVVAGHAYLGRGLEAVDAHRVTLGAGYLLILDVYLVPGGVDNLRRGLLAFAVPVAVAGHIAIAGSVAVGVALQA